MKRSIFKNNISYLISILFIFTFVDFNFAANSSSPILLTDTFSADGVGLANNTVMQRGRVDFILQNPGLLASLNNWNFNLNYIPGVFDTTYINGNIAYSLPFLTLGFAFTTFSVKSFDYFNLDGSLNANQLSMNESLFMLGVSKNLINGSNFSLDAGLSSKFLRSTIYQNSGSALLFDVGASGIFKISGIDSDFTYGLSLQNIGTGITYDQQSSSLPFKINFGIGYNLYFDQENKIMPLIEFIKADIFDSNFGVEYAYNDLLFLRLGYTTNSDSKIFSGFCLGAGVKYINISFDYGLKFSSDSDQSSISTFSLGYHF